MIIADRPSGKASKNATLFDRIGLAWKLIRGQSVMFGADILIDKDGDVEAIAQNICFNHVDREQAHDERFEQLWGWGPR